MTAPPAVLIYSNCQGIDIRRLADNLTTLRETCEFKLIQYHLLDSYEPWDLYPPAFFENVEAVWEQTGADYPEHRARFRRALPAHVQTVSFPALTMLSLWPLTGPDARQTPEPLYPAGRYPWTDVVGATLAQRHATRPVSDRELLAAYATESAAAMPDLDRRLALDVARWRARDADADVNVADYLLDTFRTEQLFHTYARLTAAPTRFMMDELIGRTDLLAASAQKIREELAPLAQRYLGYDLESCPIHPLVARHFGLKWYEANAGYRHHSHRLSYDQYIVRYIRNTPYMR